MRVKTRLFQLAEGKYKNLSELAQAMGISVGQIYSVRQGKSPISQRFIVGATKAFPNHKLDDLFYLVPELPTFTEQLAEKLVSWLRERVLAGGCKGVVFGMSGGVDSSVMAVLCQRAFPQSMLGVLMPCYSSPEDEEHALAVASKFSIPTKTVVLDSVFDTLLKVLPEDSADPAASQLAKANLRVRLRMLTLYYFANQLNYMVVGSSNKSELSVGYFTKYGDGGVDILPLGNLVKGQVRELASFLGIPQEIIDKPPSAGLWPGQTDQDELGLSYEQLDLRLVTREISDEVRERIESMMAAGSHKRLPPTVPTF